MNLPQHIEAHANGLRFTPSPRLRKLGFARQNLVGADGQPMTKASEAMAWIESVFQPRLQAVLAALADKKKPTKRLAPKPGARGISVGEAFEAFWASVEYLEKQPKTRQDYRAKAYWLKEFDPRFWDCRLDTIERGMAKGLWAAIKKRSLSMANGVVAVLRLLWNYAKDNKHVGGDNPFGKLKLKGTPPRVRVWSPLELDTILAVADEHDPEMGDAIVLAHELGQRQADILKITWDQVDASGRILITQNKTGATVAIRPQPRLVARLADAKLRRAALIERLGARVAPTIVASRHSGVAIYKMACTHRFAELREIAATRLASCATLTFQDLRDTCVTNLSEAGATTLQIASITGHSPVSVEQVLQHYHLATTAQSDGAMDLLEAYRARRAAA